MSERNRGWITARSQIAFLVGLVLASGLIFWLESVRFEYSEDPLGSFWIEPAPAPPARVLDAGARALVQQWHGPLIERLMATDAIADPAVALLTFAICQKAADPCGDRLRPAAESALALLATGQTNWDDPLRPALLLLALSALERDPTAPDPLPAYRALARWFDGFDEAQLAGRPGLAQFVARGAALSGNEYATYRSYASLRPVFQAADGLTRLGPTGAVELVLGLSLLQAGFPQAPIAERLLWQACLDWPGGLGGAPTLVALSCWSGFAAPEVDQPLAGALDVSAASDLAPLDALAALLVLLALEHGPLLAGT